MVIGVFKPIAVIAGPPINNGRLPNFSAAHAAGIFASKRDSPITLTTAPYSAVDSPKSRANIGIT